ncbi:MAG: sulfate ABC transporter substrate-binding protein [Bauldia sp.]
MLVGTLFAASAGEAASISLLNVSYDPTRELYKSFNAAFAKHWKQQSGDDVSVKQSHGGSGAQARSVIDGLDADIVTLAVESDIDAIALQSKRLPADWKGRLPNASTPFISTIVLVVRKGNPKGIKDWDDLVKPGVKVITPNPKTSGGARWNYLAAWAYADAKFGHDDRKTRDFVASIFRNVPVLDAGARGSTTTFAQRGLGDVLISWENDAFLAARDVGGDQLEIVYPSLSIRALPPVALVDKNVDAHGTRKVAEAYLNYLYSPEGQQIGAANFYRPSRPEGVAAKDLARFPELRMVDISDPLFGGWTKVQATHFNDGGVFDQIYKPR